MVTTIETKGLIDRDGFLSAVDDITKSIISVRELIGNCLTTFDLDCKDGISLISLKHNILLSYIHSLTLLSTYRLLGHRLHTRTRPEELFSDPQRKRRGHDAGDLVDVLLEDRIVLEKMKQLESKMRYQIQKLVRLGANEEIDPINEALVFRPNPEKMIEHSSNEDSFVEPGRQDRREVYQPPKMAPMPYTESSLSKAKKRVTLPTGLAALRYQDGTLPHAESTSGLGLVPSLSSVRAQELSKMREYEEANMTRLVMTKKEARRRARDEEDVALGGAGVSGRRRGDGLTNEFNDIFRSIDQRSTNDAVDGYEALRVKARKKDVFSRSRTREVDDEGGHRPMKKSRFQLAVKSAARKKRRIQT